MDVFAHSLPTRDSTRGWEPLAVHLSRVGRRAAAFAEPFDASRLALAAGLLHDIGKCSSEYQSYIRGGRPNGPDHSTAGARAAVNEYQKAGHLLAFAIAGHHSGLMDGTGSAGRGRSLADRLDSNHPIPGHDAWREFVPDLPSMADLRADRLPTPNSEYRGWNAAFFVRMLFSCLADADFLETEAFYARAQGASPPKRGGALQRSHLNRVREFMQAHRRTDSLVNGVRTEVLDHAISKASMPPGVFTLTVPTGGGKTLTSLSFALEHAFAHGLRRLVYVIPFTSIIEQTADVFRAKVGLGSAVLEHHSGFDWDERCPAGGDTDEEGRAGLEKLRRDVENWDAPIVVTTAVQFFESLFAARTSRARKLHNLARSVIVLDEAQTVPLRRHT